MHLGPLSIIFNGEIYNHLEVRKKHNLECHSHSDTETILHAYRKLGAECLHDFDGMFAFAIYNRDANELFLARDRAGEKPLYYNHEQDRFAFASEPGALFRQINAGLNDENLLEYIRFGFFYKHKTPYSNIAELPAGSYGVYSLNRKQFDIFQWWNIRDKYAVRSNDDFNTARNRVDELLHQSVKTRIESSDLEVGSFLSGGIDSGLVTAIASKYKPSLKTFTVSFENGIDEAPLAKLVAERYQTKHHEIRISFSDLVNDVEQILANYGEPHYDDSAIPSYYVSREAKKHLTVILNGDGGDELFAGYRRYVPFSKVDFFAQNGFQRFSFSVLKKLLPTASEKTSKLNYINRMLFLGSRTGFDTYLASTTDIFEGYEKDAFPALPSMPPLQQKELNEVLKGSFTGLQKQMILDFETLLPGLLLVKMDIASMANSLEGRSPFLSGELLDYVPSIADAYKIRGRTTKYLLRDLARSYLPAELINQPKRGFEPPINTWVENDLRNMIGDYLHASDPLYARYIRKDFVSRLFDGRCSVQRDKRSKMIWMLFTLEVWYRKVYKSKQG